MKKADKDAGKKLATTIKTGRELPLRIISFDLEQVPHPEFIWRQYAGFKVDTSLLLSCAFFQHGKKEGWVTHLSKKELKEYVHNDRAGDVKSRNKADRELTASVLEELNKADIILSWYGAKHDLPYINGKAILHGLQPCTQVRHLDVFKWARYKLSFSSNRLGNIATAMGLDQTKAKISPAMWDRVRNGDFEAMNTIADYNIQDVVVLDKVYTSLLPMLEIHPHYIKLMGKDRSFVCPKPLCGSVDINKWGWYYSGKGAIQKYKCNGCGYVWR